jgi:hypothetical protein
MADTEQTQTDETAATADESTETTQTDQLGDAGKAALEKERQRAKDAEKRAKEAEKRLAEIDAAAAAKEDEDAKARGEFEKLAAKRAADLEKLQTDHKTLAEERDALTAKVQAYEDRDRKTIADGVKDLPDDLKTFDPGDDAPLAARMDWFTKAQAIASKRTTDPIRGNGRPPESADGRDAKADEAARQAHVLSMTRNF